MMSTGHHPPQAAPRRRSERGQSLVEFSLMTVMMLTLLMGIIDLARAYFTYLALKDAAAEGSYFGSVFPMCRASDNCSDPNNIYYRIRNSAPSGGLVDWNDTTNTFITVNGVGSPAGQLITVTVTYNYTLITPLIGGIVGSQTLPLSAQSVAVIVGESPP